MKKSCRIRYFAILTLIGFLINTMLPFFAVYNLPQITASSNEQSPSLFGDKILICTGSDFKWVSWADLQNGKESPKPHPEYKCPSCYIAAHGLKYSNPEKMVDIAYIHIAKQPPYFFTVFEITSSKIFAQKYLSRAPPLSNIA
jgi:hypothetical protein